MGFLSVILASALLPTTQISTVASDANWIGEKLGQPITVQSSLSKKLLFISDPDCPPEKLLERIATAVHGSIRKTAGGLVLERSPRDLAMLADSERKERADWIRARLQRVEDYRKKASSSGGGFVQVLSRELQAEETAHKNFMNHAGPRPIPLFAAELLPSELLIESLIQKIGIDELAAVSPNSTVIYETAPVDKALPLSNCGDLIDAYMQASAPYENVALSKEADDAIGLLHDGPSFSQIGKETRRPERLRLQLNVYQQRQVFQLEGYDRDGKQVLTASFATDGSMKARLYINAASEDLAKPDAQWSPIPKEVQAEADLVRQAHFAAGALPPEWLAHPETTDPLNTFVYDCLKAFAAKTPTKCMVVDVHDFFWAFSRFCCKDGKLCTTGFQNQLDETEDYERIEDETSIVLRPRTPEAIEDEQVDRKILGRYVRDLIAQKGDRLRTLSVMFHDASRQSSLLAQQFARYAMQIAPSGSDALIGDPTYRLLGGISDQGWSDLMAGQTVGIGPFGITDEMRDLLVSDTRKAIGNQRVSDAQHHPIDLFDRDPVGAASVTVQSVENSLLRSQRTGKSIEPWQYFARFAALAPAAVAQVQGAIVPVGTQDDFEQRMGRDILFQLGSETKRTITILLPHGQRMEIVTSSEIREGSPLTAYRDLPQALRDKIWQDAIAYQTKMTSNSSPVQPPVRTVPPP